MESTLRITAVLADRSRNGTRVRPSASSADARSDHGTADAAPRPIPQAKALVPLEPAGERPGFGRPAPSAPFLTQLAGHQPADTGERRTRRDPALVAPRATETYRAAGRLVSDLEPGFIVTRDL